MDVHVEIAEQQDGPYNEQRETRWTACPPRDARRDIFRPVLDICADARFTLGGEINRRLEAVTRQWILPAPYANPGMLEMFRERDRERSHDMVPWAGEFAGKYLTHAVQIWRLTRDAELKTHIRWFVGELVALQAEDGYLGPWPQAFRLRKGAHTIVFQSRAGTPELNCCSVNGPRALGLLCEWAVMRRADGLTLNYYGSGTIRTSQAVLTQTTDYPREGRVDIDVAPLSKKPFTLALRIPHWSEKTRIRLNGKPVKDAKAGDYCAINRSWSMGDTLRIDLDFRPHYWVRETAVDGSKMCLCDFASAGMAGTAYETWLPVKNAPTPVPFTRENPLRSQRP